MPSGAPLICGASGTPGARGLRWYEMLNLLREIFRRTQVVAKAVVELCHMPGQVRADFLAAKLVYKMIGYRFCDQR